MLESDRSEERASAGEIGLSDDVTLGGGSWRELVVPARGEEGEGEGWEGMRRPEGDLHHPAEGGEGEFVEGEGMGIPNWKADGA